MSATAQHPPAIRRRVSVESPYRPFPAGDPAQLARNIAYARLALADSLARGEAPFASHLLYTQPGILPAADGADSAGWCDDTDRTARALGLAAGRAWLHQAELLAVYVDLGCSEGMMVAMAIAGERGIPIEHRHLAAWQHNPASLCGTCAHFDAPFRICGATNIMRAAADACLLPPAAGWTPRRTTRIAQLAERQAIATTGPVAHGGGVGHGAP